MSLNQTWHSLYLPFTENMKKNNSVKSVKHACSQKQNFYNAFICTKKKCTNTDMHTNTDKTHAQHMPHTSQLKLFWWRLSEFSVNMHAL